MSTNIQFFIGGAYLETPVSVVRLLSVCLLSELAREDDICHASSYWTNLKTITSQLKSVQLYSRTVVQLYSRTVVKL